MISHGGRSIKLKIISCNVMNHELRYCASRSCNRIDIDFLYQGLHEFPNRLNSSVQDALNRLEDKSYDYILLNYGLCGNGILNITHRTLPLVIHNVQDCIPLILGDVDRHRKYIGERPGTFWFSCGWIEGFPLPGSPDYAEKYSEFYGIFIDEEKRDIIERALIENYTHLTYIRWDELGPELSRQGRDYTRRCVESLNQRLGMRMQYDEVKGNPATLQRFVDGEWESGDFILIEPGKKLKLDAVACSLFAE